MINAVGCFFYSLETQRWMFVQRAGSSYADTWGLIGGKIEEHETLTEALYREIREEIGFVPPIRKTIPLEQFTSADQNFTYHTYVCVVNFEFIPDLNPEHKGYCWTDINTFPKPLHPGLFKTLKIDVIQDKIQTISEVI